MTATKETCTFQAEVNEVLSIVVNSLYSHREVFLRELISNASDALDKLSFQALTDHTLKGEDELTIDIIPAKDAKTLTIRDNGIGMSRDDMVTHLGTIAKSGSKALMQSLADDKKKDLALIGQFGVGFYSGFLVADRVSVTSRAAGDEGSAHIWESEAKGEFTVDTCEKEQRGTNVILHLKDDATEFLDEWGLKALVRKYSDYVRYPIRLQVEREQPVDPEKPDGDKETVRQWETINSASALWTRPKSEIEDEQYDEFYKHLSHDWEPPLTRTHFKIEGAQELTGLLFVPTNRPIDMFERKARGLRLFVKRVFVMDDCEEVLPEWLRFTRGIVDSEDLPLNVSRELLQQDNTTRFIRKQVISRTLTMLEELADEGETTTGEGDEAETRNRYEEFWGNFGTVLKEGVHVDPEYRDRIAELLRYHTTEGENLTSLADYVTRMKPDQPGIYYVTANNLATAKASPHIESLQSKGYEVLLMTDPVDEWVVGSLSEFSEKKLISAAKGALDMPESDEEKKDKEEKTSELSDVLTKVQSSLDEHIKEVRLTSRLKDSPACLVSDPDGISPHLERTLRAYGQEVPPQKRILEINPDHPVVQKLQRLSAGDGDDSEFSQWSRLLFDQALVAEGCLPEDPAQLARSIEQLMRKAAENAS